jgi:hypothetical protein
VKSAALTLKPNAKKNIQTGTGKESISFFIAKGVTLSFDQLELR